LILKVGVTGGIGSGKSYICRILESIGYPVFYSDQEAKLIILNDIEVKAKIIAEFGEEAYLNGAYNKVYIASIVFNDSEKLKILNQIVHPAVRKAFNSWAKKQNTPIVFNEAALLFENGSWKDFDKVILVHADIETRIKRLIQRDGSSEEDINRRIKSQWTDEKKMNLADFCINNSENQLLQPQIDKILLEIKQ
jgi:dephospho-CoA kinase